MASSILAFIVLLVAISNLTLFTVLPTNSLRWYGFIAQIFLVIIAFLVIFVTHDQPYQSGKRWWLNLTGGQLLTLGGFILTVCIAIWMFIVLN